MWAEKEARSRVLNFSLNLSSAHAQTHLLHQPPPPLLSLSCGSSQGDEASSSLSAPALSLSHTHFSLSLRLLKPWPGFPKDDHDGGKKRRKKNKKWTESISNVAGTQRVLNIYQLATTRFKGIFFHILALLIFFEKWPPPKLIFKI
jgi:hypothetical protein